MLDEHVARIADLIQRTIDLGKKTDSPRSRADLRRLHIALSVGFSCPVEIGRHGCQVEPTIERDDSIASHCAAVSIQVGS